MQSMQSMAARINLEGMYKKDNEVRLNPNWMSKVTWHKGINKMQTSKREFWRIFSEVHMREKCFSTGSRRKLEEWM